MKFSVETAAFADAVHKASLVGIDGIRIAAEETLAAEGYSTTSTYRQKVLDADISATGTVIVPHLQFASALRKFPTGTTTVVELDDSGFLNLTCGRLQARYATIADDGYSLPEIDAKTEVEDLSTALRYVSWVADSERSGHAPWTGITIDGERILACTKTQLCEFDLEVPVPKPITVPAAVMNTMVPRNVPVRIGISEERLALQPDDETEITAVRYADMHPIEGIQRIRQTVEEQCHERLTFSAEDFGAAIARIRTIADREDVPTASIRSDGSELILSVTSAHGDSLIDVIDCIRVGGSEEVALRLEPTTISGLTSYKGAEIEFRGRPASEPPGMVGFNVSNGVRLYAAVMRSV